MRVDRKIARVASAAGPPPNPPVPPFAAPLPPLAGSGRTMAPAASNLRLVSAVQPRAAHTGDRTMLRRILPAALLLSLACTAHASDIPALLRDLRGGWAGQATSSPEGPMPFVLLFDETPDGGLHARTHRDPESFIDLRFTKDPDGSWTLVESAGLPGLGVQSHPLIPGTSPEPGVTRFVTADPAFMHVDFRVDGDLLRLDVTLRGEPHASFELRRLPDEAVGPLRERLKAAATPAPQPALDLEALMARADAAPQDAQAQLDLGRALLKALGEDPAAGFRLASRCVKALRTAAALDPNLAEPHRLLSIYHLNAPAIGGGSKTVALEEARTYARLDPERGASFLAAIERAASGEAQ